VKSLWHAELGAPQPVLLPPEPRPLPQFVNNSAAVMAHHIAQAERDALFTMEVARKNLRNGAMLTMLSNRQPFES
jgi:hypothetical protein